MQTLFNCEICFQLLNHGDHSMESCQAEARGNHGIVWVGDFVEQHMTPPPLQNTKL